MLSIQTGVYHVEFELEYLTWDKVNDKRLQKHNTADFQNYGYTAYKSPASSWRNELIDLYAEHFPNPVYL